jgi:hypothetical protein
MPCLPQHSHQLIDSSCYQHIEIRYQEELRCKINKLLPLLLFMLNQLELGIATQGHPSFTAAIMPRTMRIVCLATSHKLPLINRMLELLLFISTVQLP